MPLSPLLTLHIAGGTIGLLAGTLAIAVRKGGPWHRRAGQVFVGAMLTLAASGATIGYLRNEPGNIAGGLITIYMIATAWLTGRHRDGRSGPFDWIALLTGAVVALYAYRVGITAWHAPHHTMNGVPAFMSFFFAFILLLGVTGDLRMLFRGQIVGARRIGRHAWRMSFGLFIATGSFFLGQQQVFPPSWRGSPILTVLALFPLALLVFWAARIRLGTRFSNAANPTRPGALPAS